MGGWWVLGCIDKVGAGFTHTRGLSLFICPQKRQEKLARERAVLEEKLRKGHFKAYEITVVLEQGLLARGTGEAILQVRRVCIV